MASALLLIERSVSMNIKSLLPARWLERVPTPEPNPAAHRWVRLSCSELRESQPLFITSTAHNHIRQSVGGKAAETGGALVGSARDGVVRHFHFDRSATTSSVTYSPDVSEINHLLKTSWRAAGLTLHGFAHSHPRGNTRPSGGDLVYAERILAARPSLDRLLMPIVQTRPDTGSFSLHGAAAYRDGSRTAVAPIPITVIPELKGGPAPDDSAWDRVRNAYDMAPMATTRLVIVGCGGSAAYIEDMVRCGIGEVVLIDPDTIDRPNLATQQVFRSDLGRPKVDAIAERLLDISRHVRVVTLQASLDDLADEDVTRLTHRPLPNTRIGGPGVSILCGFTDDFWAQARINRLALTMGVPQLLAGVYREGRGLELFYSIPGMSTACARCVLRPRYDQYLDRGFINDVTSHGTPLVATNRLNQVKSDVTLAIVHGTAANADPCHPATRRWSAVLEYLGGRNLAQIGLEPEGDSQLGLAVFSQVRALDPAGRLGFDQTVWHHKQPRPDCPDCGGTGDIDTAVGRLSPTRIDRSEGMEVPA